MEQGCDVDPSSPRKTPALRPSFVEAHRLSTIQDANIILVTENGAIVETGSHVELLAAQGAYDRLYQSQFAAPVIDLVWPTEARTQSSFNNSFCSLDLLCKFAQRR